MVKKLSCILARCVALCTVGAAVASAADASAADASQRQVDFGRDVRTILADKCFTCHGPDEERREGGLRFDQKEIAFGEADSGERAIVPGSPDESEMIVRITTDDESMQMPPEESEKPLTAEEIELLQRWVEQGAGWQEHWSLVAPQRPELPAIPDHRGANNEVDHFILARLDEEGLSPAAEADRVTLIRRVTFDLTGLPPALDEVDEFLRDDSPSAYEKVVDRLLGSKHYGEHMARFWLDAARYGDTHGLHLDNYREMWPYRDWVIRAFNRNLPYDQFVTQQLAGDLLPEPSLDQLVATGFNRCHVTTNEGGSITEEVFVRNVVDRVVTFGTVFMGLTLECTRCHDHKYDPVTMNDFYSLFAYFNSLDGNPMDGNRKDHAPVARVPTPAQQHQLDEHDRQIAKVQQRLSADWPELDQLQRQWEKEIASDSTAPVDSESLTLGDWYSVGPFPDNRRYLFRRKHGPEGKPITLDETFELATGEKVTWRRRPEWSDGTVHQDLSGDMAANFLYRKVVSPDARTAAVSLGSDDGLKVFLNGKEVLAKDISRGVAADQEKVELKLREGDNDVLLKVMNYGGATGYYFKLQSEASVIPQEILEIAARAVEDRSEEQATTLREFYRYKVSDQPDLEAVKEKLASMRKSRAEAERVIPVTLIWREKKEPVKAYLLKRGEYDQKEHERSRSTPASLPQMEADWPNNRLGLAQWLLDGNHPLTARVAVNRFWQQLFGTGIVKTAEDFGTRGERPSHTELLDWLAVEFAEDGWDIKAMMQRLVMSATYRQSSRVTRELYARDPDNRLLARGPRFRLDAEMLRDQALAVSGLLADELGGPSVKPPQPDGLWFAVGYSGSNTVRFKADEGPDKVHRRTLYTFIKRTAPPPQMSTFDGPSRESCTVRRERTNTPLQALLLFNDPQFVEAARALARRTVQQAASDEQSRAQYMFRLCTNRHPNPAELDDLVQAYQENRTSYSEDSAAAKKLVGTGESTDDGDCEASELAAWTMVANLLLNLDEVVMKN